MNQDKAVNKGLLDAGAEHSRKVRDAIASKVRDTMRLIDEEIANNHNVYPDNGGRLGQRELCRRAGIHHQTLQTPAHKDSTRLEVEAWLAKITTKTKQKAKEAVTEKADYWKEQHQIIATKIHIDSAEARELSLEVEGLKRDLQDLRKENKRLKEENASLREQLIIPNKGDNITPLRPTRKGK